MATTKATREKSNDTKRADKEASVREQYRNAGHLDGMVEAWGIAKRGREHWESILRGIAEVEGAAKAAACVDIENARRGARLTELAIAREIRRRFPKSGTASLTAVGWEPAGSGDR